MILLKILMIVAGIVIAVNLFFILAPQFGGTPDKKRMDKLSENSIYSEGRFENLSKVPVMLPGSYGKVLKLQFRKDSSRVPSQILPAGNQLSEISGNGISVVWLGHSTLLINIDGKTILTDPVFSKRVSPLSFIGPKAFKTEVKYTVDMLPKLDAVLISHDHFDHLDYQSVKALKDKVPVFLVPLGVKAHLLRWGVSESRIIEFDWGTGYSMSDSLKLTTAPAQHFSGRRKQNNSTLWCSWIISGASGKVYFSGDSGYGEHFKQIGEEHGPFDLTLMECGAYGTYWPYIHMLPEESIQAHVDLKGRYYLPIHWGKYNLAFHSWQDPAERMLAKSQELDVDVVTPVRGEILHIPPAESTAKWWREIE